MENNKILNEENFQKNKKKVTKMAIIVLVLGILIGGSLIATGLVKQHNVNSQYSEKSKADLQKQLEDEKQILLEKKAKLKDKIDPVEKEIKDLKREPFTGFDKAYYEREDKIEELEESILTDKKSIDTIDNALDDSFAHCSFGDVKNNMYTSKYCSLKNQLEGKTDFNRDFDSFDSIPFYMFGAFVIVASCIAAGSIYMFAKRREIMAFTVQQAMPIVKEGIETIAPTIGNVAKENLDKMAPSIGNVAKEISKGIKDGLKDDKK